MQIALTSEKRVDMGGGKRWRRKADAGGPAHFKHPLHYGILHDHEELQSGDGRWASRGRWGGDWGAPFVILQIGGDDFCIKRPTDLSSKARGGVALNNGMDCKPDIRMGGGGRAPLGQA